MIRYGIWKRILFAVALLMISSVVLTACGDDDDDDDADPTNTTASGQTASPATGGEPTSTTGSDGGEEMDMGDLSGEVVIDGSSTVFPVAQAVSEEFIAMAPDVQFSVSASGTGGGFEKFCAGDTDVSNASRPIEEDEIALCEENGIEFAELQVGVDGLSVVVHPDNDWVDCITTEQLAMIWGPDSTVDSWADVDSSWPDEPIDLYGPGTDSGTFDYFTDVINGEEGASRADYTASEDDNVLVTGVSGSQYSMGYFGYAYYIENQDSLKVLAVDGGEGCVEPNPETVASGEYAPLSRPLFMYVSIESLQRPEVAAFFEFVLSEDGQAIVPEVGYVALSEEQLAEQQSRLESAIAGEAMMDESGSEASPTTASGGLPEMDYSELSGDVVIDGSSTVFPVAQAASEELLALAPDVQFSVNASGTGGGFEKFCAGDTDISNASRPISDEEAALCEENGIEYTEFQVGVDGLSVVVHPDNDWVDCITTEQLTMIWGPDSSVTNWSDVDPSWPDEAIDLYGPGTDSGTFDYFTEEINGEAGASRPDYTASEDDNVLVQGVSGSDYSMGYFGYAYYIENQDSLKVLAVDGGEGCVEPNPETVASGEYAPLSRPLFMYASNASILEKPQVAGLFHFVLSEDGQVIVSEIGYIALSEEQLATEQGEFASLMQ